MEIISTTFLVLGYFILAIGHIVKLIPMVS